MDESQIYHLENNFTLLTNFYIEKLRSVFKISSRIKLTCLSVCPQYVAVGTNGGSVYVLVKDEMKYFTHFVANADFPISAVKFSPNGRFLATISQDGSVLIYGVPTDGSLKMDCLRKCLHHRKSEITAFVWDAQSSVFYTGDKKGVVSATHTPLSGARDFFTVTNEPILKLDCEVVQLDSFDQYVLVSTFEKCLLCNNSTRQFITIGSKPRKGLYGACFWLQEDNNLSSVKIVCARPGMRFWIASMKGVVEQTQQYKDINILPTTKPYSGTQVETSNQNEESGGEFFSYLSSIRFGLICAITPRQSLFLIDPSKKQLIAHIEMFSRRNSNFNFEQYSESFFVLDSERSFYSFTVGSVWYTIDLLLTMNQFDLAYDLVMTYNPQVTESNSGDILVPLEVHKVLSPDRIDSLINHALISEPKKSHKELVYLKEHLFKEPGYQRCHDVYFLRYSPNGDSPSPSDELFIDDLGNDEEIVMGLNGHIPPPPVIMINDQIRPMSEETASIDNDDTSSLNSNDSETTWIREVIDQTRSSTSLGIKNISSRFDKLKKQLKISQKNRDMLKRFKERTSAVLSLDNMEHLLTIVDSLDYDESPNIGSNDASLDRVFNSQHSYPKLINFVELEADVYITWEKLKDNVTTSLLEDHLAIMTNFINVFNRTTMLNWRNRFDFELHKYQLSVTVNLDDLLPSPLTRNSSSPLTVKSDSRSGTPDPPALDCESTNDDVFVNVPISSDKEDSGDHGSDDRDVQHVSLSVSRSQTLPPELWAKPLSIPLKIHGLTTFLLTIAFENHVYGDNFNDMDQFFNEQIHGNRIDSDDNDGEFVSDHQRSVCSQVNLDFSTKYAYLSRCRSDKFFPVNSTNCQVHDRVVADLVDMRIWQEFEPSCFEKLPYFVSYYGCFLDKAHIRHWLRGCSIHPQLWNLLLHSLGSSSHGKPSVSHLDVVKSSQFMKLLHDSILEETLESLIVFNNYFAILGSDSECTDFLVTHCQYLSNRDIIYLCLNHRRAALIPAYFDALRNHVNMKIRSKLCESICSSLDIFLCVVICILSDRTVKPRMNSHKCSCGYFICESENEFLYKNLLQDILSVFRVNYRNSYNSAHFIDKLSSLFQEYGYASGYLEVLAIQRKTDDIIKLGVQLANEQILNRIKDYAPISESDIRTCIDYRLQQGNTFCLQCGMQLPAGCPAVDQPITWEQIAFFMHRHISLQETILLLLRLENKDINSIAPFLNSIFSDSLASFTNRKSFSIDQSVIATNGNNIVNFIKREIQLVNQLESGTLPYKEQHQQLTEDLLNYFVADRDKLISASDWGFLFRKDIECSVCGLQLQNSAACSLNINAFSCGHIYHQNCLDGESSCIICLFN